MSRSAPTIVTRPNNNSTRAAAGGPPAKEVGRQRDRARRCPGRRHEARRPHVRRRRPSAGQREACSRRSAQQASRLAAEARQTRKRSRSTRSPSSRRSCVPCPGEWFVVHSYAGYENRVKANLETRIVSLNMEDYIFEIQVPMEDVTEIKNGQKKQVRQRPDARLRARAHGPDRRVVGGGPAYPRGNRICRQCPPADPAEYRRGPCDAGPGAAGGDSGRGCVRCRGRRWKAKEIRVLDFDIGESVTVMEGPFETLRGHDLRDQRRHPEAQSSGLHLRSGDPSRTVLHPGRQDLSRNLTED